MAGSVDNRQWIRIVGTREIEMNLFNLTDPKTMGKKVLQPAIRKGLKPIRDKAKAKVPKRYGHLAASLKIGIAKGTFSGKVYVDPNYRRKAPDGSTIRPAKYAHLVEFGTSQKSGASLSKKTGKLHRWLHSATQAKPFLRPALEEGKKEAFKIIAAAAAENFKKLKPGLGI